MDVIMPQLGESVDEGTIAAWHKKPGDPVAVDEVLLEVETDKVATEVPSLVAGVLREILVPEGETVKVGTRLAVIEEAAGTATASSASSAADDGSPAAEPVAAAAAPAAARQGGKGWPRQAPDGTPLSPAVRRLIAHHGLDPAAIRGTGRGGRIQRADVLAHLEAQKLRPAARADDRQEVEVVPFTTMRRRIAEHMRHSKATSAHVLQAIEVDFSAVAAARDFLKHAWREQHGAALSYLPFIARAVCLALGEFPRLNAHVAGDALHVHKSVHLSFAIDLAGEGLLAPVLRDAGAMPVGALARGIADLARRARAGQLTPDDLRGGTYSLTNNGSFGTMLTAPIINQPQVAILSTDGIRKRPWVVETAEGDELAIRPVGILAQSFDHRAVDGAYSGAFLQRLKELLETYDWAKEFV